LLIEGEEQAVRTAGGLDVPVAGRIGVIVYASVGVLPAAHCAPPTLSTRMNAAMSTP
jgi:hypothetical protein